MQEENDVEFQRGLLTRKMEAGEDVVIQTDKAAVLRNVILPKAQYHFVVLPKEDIANVTALTRDHLQLLDHMMELANQTIEQQKHLPSSKFLVGFKMESFMNRLNMHVISNDFCSDTMRRIQHWNTFNTDLFITYQAVYALLKVKGSIEPLSPDTAEKLLTTRPFHCNQCRFITGNFNKFKEHLQIHWQRQENERINKMNMLQLKQSFGNMNINGNFKNDGSRQNVGHRSENHIVENKQQFNSKQERQELHVTSPVGTNLTNPRPYKKWYNKKKQNSQMPEVKPTTESAKKI
ncbi:aprataxin-like protein [Drosophila innubila]|uniref:aprataxin-like protein n=1 Tax=Drosophila innubila TaxID=198719 RepID=UPI00148DCB60|nr:aprataxin-like protein [Drosophila innubila]